MDKPKGIRIKGNEPDMKVFAQALNDLYKQGVKITPSNRGVILLSKK
ncbi:hypothetical protein ACM26V_09325 [Salipaludibacillus sp. HK11]